MPTKTFPAYLLLGEEDFLKEEAVEELKSRFLDSQTKDLNYSIFYGREKNLRLKEMFDSLNTAPFLSKKRLVVLRNADSLPPSEKKSILAYLQHPKESSIFVIESPLPFIKGEFLLEVSKMGQLVYSRRLTDSGIRAWLVKKASLSGKKISSEAIEAIKENLANDLRSISSNMEIIILYTGKRSVITKQDVETVTGKGASRTAFDLIDSIGKKDVKRSLHIFSSFKKDRRKETELLGLLAWNARMVLRIKELLRIKTKIEMRKDLGLYQRRFDELVGFASGFKKKEILALLDGILRADLDIKTGMKSSTVIERLIVRMCS